MNLKNIVNENLLEIILILIIPAVTLGFTLLENTSEFQNAIGVGRINYAVQYKLQGTDTNQQHFLHPLLDEEFNDVWNLIRNKSGKKFSNTIPSFIGVLIVKNPSYTELLVGNGSMSEIQLIPDTALVLVGFCNVGTTFGDTGCELNKNTFLVGSINDIKTWNQQVEASWRNGFDTLFACLSILIGLIYIKQKQNKK